MENSYAAQLTPLRHIAWIRPSQHVASMAINANGLPLKYGPSDKSHNSKGNNLHKVQQNKLH